MLTEYQNITALIFNPTEKTRLLYKCKFTTKMATKLLAQAWFLLKMGNLGQSPNFERHLTVPWAVKSSLKPLSLSPSIEINHVDSRISLDKCRFLCIISKFGLRSRHTQMCMTYAFASGCKVQKCMADSRVADPQ
jgi:hypothetical protein